MGDLQSRGDGERPRGVADGPLHFVSLIRHCKSTRDYLVPSVWGPVDKKEDPYAPSSAGCNCSVM